VNYYAGLKAAKRDMVANALVDAGGNCLQAAKQLGIGFSALYKLTKALDLTHLVK
jgi:transcriptional regulator of acetoin/glycerol metabolism